MLYGGITKLSHTSIYTQKCPFCDLLRKHNWLAESQVVNTSSCELQEIDMEDDTLSNARYDGKK